MRGKLREFANEIQNFCTVKNICQVKKFQATERRMRAFQRSNLLEKTIEAFRRFGFVITTKPFKNACVSFKARDRFTNSVNHFVKMRIEQDKYKHVFFVEPEGGKPSKGEFKQFCKEHDYRVDLIHDPLSDADAFEFRQQPKNSSIIFDECNEEDVKEAFASALFEFFVAKKNLFENNFLLGRMHKAIDSCEEEIHTKKAKICKLKAIIDINLKASSLVSFK